MTRGLRMHTRPFRAGFDRPHDRSRARCLRTLVALTSVSGALLVAASGAAAFGTFDPAVDFDVGANPQAVRTGDFDRDGARDLAVANGNDDDVSILLGKGDGSFDPAVDYAVGDNPTALV